MKKPITLQKLLLACAVLCCGCNGGKVAKEFPIVKELRAEFIPHDQILQTTDLIKLDDFVILRNGSEHVEDFFFVYSYPEWKFLYSFAKYGRGPHEYLFPNVIVKNTPGNLISFKDHATDLVATYEVTPAEAVLKESRPFPSKDSRFFWEMNYMEDSLYLVKHQDDRKGARELWDIRSRVLVDSLANAFPDLPAEMGRNYYTLFDDYLISACGNRFAIGYSLIDRIEFGSVDRKRMRIDARVGMESPPQFYSYGHDETHNFKIDKNTVFYENLYTTDRNVYALYANKRMDETEQHHSSQLEVYAWDATPVALYHLEYPVASFFVDEAERTIYGINPSLFDDRIIRYSY